MKKLSIATVTAVIIALLVSTVAFALFNNGNFENGDFTGWIKDATQLNGGILVGPPPSYVPVAAASVVGASLVDDTFIVNTAWMNTNFGPGVTCDPYSNGEICLPYSGGNSAVVNYLGSMSNTANNMNTLSQVGGVGLGDLGLDGNYHIFFTYAPVLDKGAHPASDQPFMFVRLIRGRTGSPDKVLFDKFSYPDDGNPNWKISPVRSSVKYMPWQVYDLTYSPGELIPGDTLKLEVTAAGCVYTQGAHWGYVYVDEFGPIAPIGTTAPSISGVSPNTGPGVGGTTVTITGTNFTTATAVTIGTTTFLSGSFTIVNDTTITFVTPAHADGTVDIAVTNTSGSAFFPNSFTYTSLPPTPTITGVSPSVGPAAGGTTVTITGTNLTGGDFSFGGTTSSCIVAGNGLSATCTTPAHASGLVDVVVTTLNGTDTEVEAFTYLPSPAPTISSIVPNSGPTAGGTTVVITGTNLTGGTVTFDGTAATCTVDSATQITCTSPSGTAGAVDVVVTTPDGSATSVGGFTYIAAPTIGSIIPNSGPTAGGTSVVITGTNLATTFHVEFGAAPASCTVNSDTQITCTLPAHAAGLVDVDISTLGGIATSVNGFTYIPAPTITGLVPNSGPMAGGTTVVITGTGLATTFHVEFGATPASCTANSDTQITCTSPAHAAGPVDVDVSTIGGLASSTNGFTYIAVPTIISIVPNSGPTAGGTTVVITGTNLTGGTVTFGGLDATCTVNSATQITCSTPSHTIGTVDVVVTTPIDTATSAGGFLYADRDTVGVFRPTTGNLFLKNDHVTGFADINIMYGQSGDYPVKGDWNGDGIDTIGVYRNGLFYLRNSNATGIADIVFAFGQPGDQPVAGDWDGDGVDTIGVYNSATYTFYLRNSLSSGAPDHSFMLGLPGDVGIAGDWTGKGFDTVGVYRPSNGVMYLQNSHTGGFAEISLNYGLTGDKPVTGDWNNDGIDTIGVMRGDGKFYLKNDNTIGFADIIVGLGNPGDMPIAGNWDGIP